jgi:hypothetical protein
MSDTSRNANEFRQWACHSSLGIVIAFFFSAFTAGAIAATYPGWLPVGRLAMACLCSGDALAAVIYWRLWQTGFGSETIPTRGVRPFRTVLYAHCAMVLFAAACWPILDCCVSRLPKAADFCLATLLGVLPLACAVTPLVLLIVVVTYRLPLWRAGPFIVCDVILLLVQWAWTMFLFA